MPLLEQDLLQQLKAAGYSGGNTIEDVLKPISIYLRERGQEQINNHEWWIEVKDQGILQGKRFQLVMVEKWIQHFGV